LCPITFELLQQVAVRQKVATGIGGHDIPGVYALPGTIRANCSFPDDVVRCRFVIAGHESEYRLNQKDIYTSPFLPGNYTWPNFFIIQSDSFLDEKI